jgi:death on curing protein
LIFLTVEEVLFIHQSETEFAGHNSKIRDLGLLESAVENTRLLYDQNYSTDLFFLAASYLRSIAINHPFVDGNKRTALASALVFLEYNGFIIKEDQDESLADLVLDFVNKKIDEKVLAKYLMDQAIAKDVHERTPHTGIVNLLVS